MHHLHALDDAAHDGAFVGGGVDEREEEVHREPVAELARGASSGLVARGSEVRPRAFGAEGVRDDRERAVVRLLDPNALLERRHDAFAEELAEVRGVAAKRPEAKRGGGGGVCGVRVMIRGWYVRFRVGVLVARSLGDGGEGFVEAREGVGGAGEVSRVGPRERVVAARLRLRLEREALDAARPEPRVEEGRAETRSGAREGDVLVARGRVRRRAPPAGGPRRGGRPRWEDWTARWRRGTRVGDVRERGRDGEVARGGGGRGG